jgi:hypothetical protein
VSVGSLIRAVDGELVPADVQLLVYGVMYACRPETPFSSGSSWPAAVPETRSNQSIANSLFVSEKTVQACTGHIFAKLGLDPGPDDYRRVRAVLTYLQAAVDES